MLPRLAEAIGFLAVFGLVAWAVAVRIVKDNTNKSTNNQSNNNLQL